MYACVCEYVYAHPVLFLCLFYSSVYLPSKSYIAQSMPQCGNEMWETVSFTKTGNWIWHQENARLYQIQSEILPKDKHTEVRHCQCIQWKFTPGIWIRVLNFCTGWRACVPDSCVCWKASKLQASKKLKSKGLMSSKKKKKKRPWETKTCVNFHWVLPILGLSLPQFSYQREGKRKWKTK